MWFGTKVPTSTVRNNRAKAFIRRLTKKVTMESLREQELDYTHT